MVIDQHSLFFAAGICAAALAMTMLTVWLHNRADRFLIGWMLGMVLLGAGVILYANLPLEWTIVTAVSFTLQLLGFVVILASARLFTGRTMRSGRFAVLALLVVAPVTMPILFGYDGLGIMLYNYLAGMLLLATAAEYWTSRFEAPSSIITMATLYMLAALSFLACGAVLLHEGNWVLDGRPDNWAEQFNAVMCIAGITGIGALSIGLNHARAASRHRQEARTDALTGLLNRRALFGSFPHRMPPGAAIVAFDLDRFKAINDRHGHATGDEVLRLFADALLRNARDGDLAARTGGEEFVLVMPDTTVQVAASTAERIRARFAAGHVETESGRLRVTASAGIALTRSASESFEDVLGRADSSLYQAKNNGRDRVISELQAVA